MRVRVCVCVCTQSYLTLCDPMHWDPLSMELSHQAILSMGLSQQECCSGLPFPSPGDLPHPGIRHESPALQTDSLKLSHLGSPEVALEDQECLPVLVFLPGSLPLHLWQE